MYIKGRQEERTVVRNDGWSDERCDRSTYGLICLLGEVTLHVDSQFTVRSKCSMTNCVISG